MSTNPDDTKWYSYTSSTQTMRTWARRIRSYEEVPAEFQPAFPEYGEHFPYTLLIPQDRLSLFHRRNEQMICLYQDRLVHLELVHHEIKTLSSSLQEVLYVERGMILLYSWLKIVTPSGTLWMRFNTTNEYLFSPVIETIRQEMSGSSASDQASGKRDQTLSRFDYLVYANYKYMNYGRESVRANDAVVDVVYQPDRPLQEITLFGRTLLRRCMTGHLSVLTENELILIREDKRIRINQEASYGGVFTYIPRRQIHDISFVSDRENAHCVMQITLPENTRLVSEFSLTNEELGSFQEHLGRITISP